MKYEEHLLAVALMFGFSAQLVSGSARLEGRIVDDATGQALAARVALTDVNGNFVDVEGPHDHVQYLDKRWCYVNGSFTLNLTNKTVQVEIRRGLETRPLTASISANATGPIIFRLRRWIDMRTKGYFNGDFHAHAPVPQKAQVQMRAEDLNALTLLYVGTPQSPYQVNDCFIGRQDPISTPGCEIRVSQEVQDWQMGHLTLLNLTHLVPGYPDFGGGLEYWRSNPQWDLVRAMRATRAQGGLVFWSHFSSLPGAQSPIGIALGLVDGLELITWNDPTQLPNHWSPWQNSGMSQAEFPIMRPVDLYYQYLNAGFRVPIAAGTDKFADDIPLGSNRTFAQLTGPASYAAWLEAIKTGRVFVSNGPILEFEAAGHQPGDVVPFQQTNHFKAHATARSILPFTTLDIIVNGQTVAHKTVPVQRNPPVDGLYSMEVEATIELSHSSWVAARVAEHPDLRHRILPRGLSVFAHTGPIYFLQDGRKVHEKASILYLRQYVGGVLHWLETNPTFATEADRQDARKTAEEALRVYQSL